MTRILAPGILALAALSLGTSALAASPRPNIIVILADDLGFSDIGCYGSEVPTPNLDKLAADGVRFTQFYNTPRCSPTRAALLTGLYSQQAGMGWLDNKVEPKSRGFHGCLLPRCVTIAEVLRDAGYFTAMTGKWHLGQQNGTPPWKRGFMRSLNSRFGEVYFPKEAGGPGTQMLYLNGREIPKDSPELGNDWYSTDLFVDWGLKFIDEARAEQKPFFLYIAQGTVHFPLRAPADVIAHYRGKYMQGWDKLRDRCAMPASSRWGLSIRSGRCRRGPTIRPAWETRAPDRQKRFDDIMSVYAAMIECLDRSTGRLVAGLKEREPAGQHADHLPERQWRQRRGRTAGRDERHGSHRRPAVPCQAGHELGDAGEYAFPPLQALHARRRHQLAAHRALAPPAFPPRAAAAWRSSPGT